MSLWLLAVRNLLRRPARSLLTAAAVALGLGAVVTLTSIAWGFEASWQRANDARGTDLIVTRAASENTLPAPFVAAPNERVMRDMPGVRDVVGMLNEMLGVGDGAAPLFVFGWAYDSYLWEHLRLVSGRWPASDGEPAVVLGEIAAELLHKRPGQEVEVEGRRLRVVGIFESSAVVENGALVVTLSQAQQLTDKPGKVNVLNLRLARGATESDIAAIQTRVRAALPGYVAFTSGQLVRRNAIVRIAKAMSGATTLVAALVGALVVFNSMLMAVNERTREIGLLQAVGWPRRTIVGLVVAEALVLSVAGGVAGVALGVAGTLALERLEIMRGKFEAVFAPQYLPLLLALSALVGVAGGLLPALRAARLRPALALRQE